MDGLSLRDGSLPPLNVRENKHAATTAPSEPAATQPALEICARFKTAKILTAPFRCCILIKPGNGVRHHRLLGCTPSGSRCAGVPRRNLRTHAHRAWSLIVTAPWPCNHRTCRLNRLTAQRKPQGRVGLADTRWGGPSPRLSSSGVPTALPIVQGVGDLVATSATVGLRARNPLRGPGDNTRAIVAGAPLHIFI